MRVAAGARPVDAAGRRGAAPEADVVAHGLHRVIGLGEEREVRRRGDVLARRPELRQPEAVEVRLVPDDHVLHGGSARTSAAVYEANSRPRGRRERRRRRTALVDGDEEPDVPLVGGPRDRRSAASSSAAGAPSPGSQMLVTATASKPDSPSSSRNAAGRERAASSTTPTTSARWSEPLQPAADTAQTAISVSRATASAVPGSRPRQSAARDRCG